MTTDYTDPTVKHDALLLFDVIDSNPNGDPDNGGKPRTDFETGEGLVTDVSIKRKIRDTVSFFVEQGLVDPARNKIFIRRGHSLNEQLEAAYKFLGQPLAKGKKPNPADHVAAAQKHMIQEFFDIRMFGAVMSTGKASAGKVTGPVTVGIARSVDPVQPIDFAITRVASTKKKDRNKASQMGSKAVVPYGLYAMRIHYQPTRDNQVTAADMKLLWMAIEKMFEITRSAARPDISIQGLFVFSHDRALGNAPARTLLDMVSVTKREEVENPTSFDSYELKEPSGDAMPEGVTYKRLI